MPVRTVRSGPYFPSAPRTGGEGEALIFRKNNLITQGRDGHYYEEVYSGELNLQENFALGQLTGTVQLTAGSTMVDGAGTLFTAEVHLGHYYLALDATGERDWLLVPKRIIDDTTMEIWKAPDTSISGIPVYRLSRLYEINNQRGVSWSGNVLQLDQGHFIGVGSGTFYLNGLPLPGTSLVLARHVQLALLNAAAGTYSVFPLGMTTPAAPTAVGVAGGTKGMQGGTYSLVITPSRKETGGYNNPTLKSVFTIATGDKVRVTFPAMDTANGQSAWKVWVTTFADSLGADLNFENGPWSYYIEVTNTDVSPAGGTFDIEWLDAEVQFNETVSFNNDAPVDAEWIAMLNNIAILASCQGQGNVVNPTATSPGPFIVSFKPNNAEAAPLDLAFSSSPPETILWVLSANGRLYLLTPNHLQIAQATPSDVVPTLIRPYWRDGFAGPDQLLFIDDYLYGCPVGGPTRSLGEGDVISASRDWAAPVAEITKHWNRGQMKVGYDPKRDMVVFVHAADHLNDEGFWTTRLLGFGIEQDFWIFDRLLTSPDHDMIVSGIATVGESLEFLIGGRGLVAPVILPAGALWTLPPLGWEAVGGVSTGGTALWTIP